MAKRIVKRTNNTVTPDSPKPHAKRLTAEDRKKARDAFNALMDAPDDDPQAIAIAVTATSLLEYRKKKREEKTNATREGRHGR